MIRTKKELEFYIMADRMMNRGYFKPSLVQRIKNLLVPDYTMRYLVAMRKCSYYSQWGGVRHCVSRIYNQYKYRRLGVKLGFSIGYECFGYGLVIPHYGTIVVGGPNRVGNYAVLHTSTCITARPKTIGNGLYLSTGAKITTGENLGDGVTIAANSVVTKGCQDGFALLAGMPAEMKNDRTVWYEYESGLYNKRVEQIELIKNKMGI